jgi:hypothetical protein
MNGVNHQGSESTYARPKLMSLAGARSEEHDVVSEDMFGL